MNIDVKRIIGTSDFRAQAAKIFDDVQAGATYVVTRGSRPIAIITPVPQETTEVNPGPNPAPPATVDPEPIDIE